MGAHKSLCAKKLSKHEEGEADNSWGDDEGPNKVSQVSLNSAKTSLSNSLVKVNKQTQQQQVKKCSSDATLNENMKTGVEVMRRSQSGAVDHLYECGLVLPFEFNRQSMTRSTFVGGETGSSMQEDKQRMRRDTDTEEYLVVKGSYAKENSSYLSGISMLLNEFDGGCSVALPSAMRQSKSQQTQTIIRVSDFKKIKLLSSNARTQVWLCEKEGVPYSVKSISRQFLEEGEGSSEGLQRVLRERDVLATLQSNHFIRLEYALLDATHLHFITDYKAKGSLKQWMETNNSSLCLEEVKRIIAQIVVCLFYLHEELGYVYRALQSENVLFDELDRVSLCDFADAISLSQVKEAGKLRRQHKHSNVEEVQIPPAAMGNENLSPEQKHGFTEIASDFWQLGIVVYQLVYRVHPLKSATSALQSHGKIKRNAFDGSLVPVELMEFMQKCFNVDHRSRIASFYQVQQTKLFTDFDWQSVVESYECSKFPTEFQRDRNDRDYDFDNSPPSFLFQQSHLEGSGLQQYLLRQQQQQLQQQQQSQQQREEERAASVQPVEQQKRTRRRRTQSSKKGKSDEPIKIKSKKLSSNDLLASIRIRSSSSSSSMYGDDERNESDDDNGSDNSGAFL